MSRIALCIQQATRLAPFPDPREHATYLLESCCGNYLEAYEIAELNSHSCANQAYWEQVAEAIFQLEPELPMVLVTGDGHPLRDNCLRWSEAEMFNRLLRHVGSDRRWMLLTDARNRA
jgi:hypothetical protein